MWNIAIGGCNSKALLDAQIKALMNNFEGVGKLGNFEVNWSDLMKLNKSVYGWCKWPFLILHKII